MSAKIVDVADLDCIYLSYDEPRKEEFWAKINAMVPWAKRVDGIKGSDAAHKAAAAASDTERFILIDGDNLPDPKFFDQQLLLTEKNENCVFRWKALNNINGLTYGNGGLSCWTKEFINNMRTHEATDGQVHTAVEFCWNSNYLAMHDVWSTTYPNQSQMHAWRAGFREGVKMCLDRGVKPSIMDFQTRVSLGNMRNLSIWHNIGSDAEFGDWAILGARMGTVYTMIDGWDYKLVHDFDELKKIYDDVASFYADGYITNYLDKLANELEIKLGLDMIIEDAVYSRFFKKYATQRQNRGIMILEGQV